MKYLLLFIPTLAFANYVSETGSVTYWDKAVCEKAEQAVCFEKPTDSETKTLKEVTVPDITKPIIAESAPISGSCTPPAVMDGTKNVCVTVTGYETKLEKQFVEDAAKVAGKEAEKTKQDLQAQSCAQFKVLLDDSAIDSKSSSADVQEVVRRLLGFYKTCR